MTFFFTYDVEFLHLAFLFFTNVAVVTFVTVFTFKVLTGIQSRRSSNLGEIGLLVFGLD